MSVTAPVYDRSLSIGLGEAIERLINLHTKVAGGFSTPDERAERTMLLSALNVIPLDLSFSCDIAQAPAGLTDGPTNSVAMFATSASTSCCRLVPPPRSPEPIQAKPAATVKPVKPAIPASTASGLTSMFTMPKLGSRR